MAEINESLDDYLARRNAEHETEYHLTFSEADVVDLASGCVPKAVQAMCRTALDWALEDERKAAANVAQETHRHRKARARAGKNEEKVTA